MKLWKTKLIVSVSLVGLVAAPSLAQDSTVLNEQIQLNDVWSNMTVVMPDYIHGDAVANAAAYGNVVSASHQDGAINFTNAQTHEADTSATTNVEVETVSGVTAAVSTAFANSAVSDTCCGPNNSLSEQTANGTTQAQSNVTVNDSTDHLSVGATATANVQSVSAYYGDIAAFSHQEANGDVIASSDVKADTVYGYGAVATTALGNSITSSGYSTTSYNGATQYTDGDIIAARSDVEINNADSITAVSTAGGNTHTVYNEWGYATLGRQGSDLYQQNGAAIRSETYVTLDEWSGHATSSAYGVGNSALISNIGSDAALHSIQNNFGSVDTVASLDGGTTQDGTAYVTATSIGNAASATTCYVCGDASAGGSSYQFNSGATTATGIINVGGHTGTLIGSAAAIGNTASYHTSSQH